MPNPENIENHRWVKGQSGNPNGRPPGKSVSSILNDLLGGNTSIKEIINGIEQKRVVTRGEMLALKLFEKAGKGDLRAIQEILDRTEGKPLQKINQKNEDRLQKIIVKVVREEAI